MKIIFISGALTTGGDGSKAYIEKNIRKAEEYTITLAKEGVGFFCPHTHTSNHHGVTEESFYHELDFRFLEKSDAIMLVPGWEKSKGAKAEVVWAQKNGMKIFYPKNPNDIAEITKWARE